MKKLGIILLCLFFLSACSKNESSQSMVVYYSDLNEKIEKDEQLTASEIKDLQSTSLLLEQSVPDHWKECDVIYIGFPVNSISTPPAPVSAFLSQNDLKHKTFIPFTIGTQEELDHARESLTFDRARKGWENGKAFSPSYTDLDIKEWVEKEKEI